MRMSPFLGILNWSQERGGSWWASVSSDWSVEFVSFSHDIRAGPQEHITIEHIREMPNGVRISPSVFENYLCLESKLSYVIF